MSDTHSQFVPQNPLEEQLLAAQEGQVSETEFMQTLLDSELFMPILERHAIGGLQESQLAQPLTLEDESGEKVLPLFTTPDRAREFLRDYPGYEGGLLAQFTWILERTGTGIAITINPGWPAGLDLEAEQVQQLAAHTAEAQQP